MGYGHTTSDALIGDLLTAAGQLRYHVDQRDWKRSSELATTCLGLGQGMLRRIQHEAAESAEKASALKAMRQAYLAELESATGEERETLEELVAALDELGQPAFSWLDRDAALAVLGRGLLGAAHVGFNRNYTELVEHSTPWSDESASRWSAEISSFADSLRSLALSIYTALTSGASAIEKVEVAERAAAQLERAVPSFAARQAELFCAAAELRESGKGGASERVGRLAMQAGTLVRGAVASHIAACRLAAEILWPMPSEVVKDFVASSSRLPFESQLPDGKNTQLAKLGEVADKTDVELEGFVTAVTAKKDSSGKLIGELELHDPSSGAKTVAVALFLHFGHAGMTPGCYVRINGSYRSTSKLAGGVPAIEVERLPLASLAEQSWRVGFLRLAGPWFTNWRNGHNMYWSLGPQLDEQHEGAGELIYPPFVRGQGGADATG